MKRILVVSDDAKTRKLFSDVLSYNHENMIVLSAEYGQAEEEMKRKNIKIDLAVVDFAAAFEAAKHVKIRALMNFINEKSSDAHLIAMVDEQLEERAARMFKPTRMIQKPGVKELLEI